MSDSLFDPAAFLEEDQDELSTERVLVPMGVHAAFIEEQELTPGTDENGKDWLRLNLKWNITEPAVLEEMGRDKVYLTQRIFLVRDPDTGKLSTKRGDNWQLGQVRKAIGKVRGPLSDLVGGSALLEVKHRVFEGKPQEDIRSVAAA